MPHLRAKGRYFINVIVELGEWGYILFSRHKFSICAFISHQIGKSSWRPVPPSSRIREKAWQICRKNAASHLFEDLWNNVGKRVLCYCFPCILMNIKMLSFTIKVLSRAMHVHCKRIMKSPCWIKLTVLFLLLVFCSFRLTAWKFYNFTLRCCFPFTLLQHAFKIGKDAVKGYQPTYVYPACLKAVVREVAKESIRDYKDPVGPNVSFVLLVFWHLRTMFLQQQQQVLFTCSK